MDTAVKDGGTGPAQIIEANFSTAFATLYLLVVSAAIFVCCLSILAATIRLCFGMARDNQLPHLGPLVQGVTQPAHAGLDLHRRRACCAVTLHQVLGRRDHRDRRDRHDLPQLLPRQPRDHAGCGARGWPQDQRAVPARPLGPAGQRARAALRRGACWSTSPGPGSPRTRSRSRPAGWSFGWGFVDKIPILWLVLAVVLIVGSLYYWIRRAHIPSPVLTETAAAEAA